MKTVAVLTSGGDAPGMNSAIRAVARIGAARGMRVLGVEHGYEGLIDGRFRELTSGKPGAALQLDRDVDLMGGRGGTLLGSARSKRFRAPEGRTRAFEQMREAGIDGMVVVGGNGSLTGAHALCSEHAASIIGVPASIDNDIGCTSTAIGVDTALNTIVDACDRISDTARAHRRAFVVEVMGRHCGYLAMASAVAAGADAVLFREQGRNDGDIVDAVVEYVRGGFSSGKNRVLIIKSEGVEIPCTRLAREVSDRIEAELPGVDVRATVLGHVVRGGRPSFQDRMIAARLAYAALELLGSGHSDRMVAWGPTVEGGTKTGDPMAWHFPLAVVLEETAALLDGTSELTRWRVSMLEKLEGVLGL